MPILKMVSGYLPRLLRGQSFHGIAMHPKKKQKELFRKALVKSPISSRQKIGPANGLRQQKNLQ